MSKGRPRKNKGPCIIRGCENTSETFRKLTEESLKKVNKSPKADLIINTLKVGDELCQKHYNDLVVFDRAQKSNKKKRNNDLSYNPNTSKRSKILKYQQVEVQESNQITRQIKPYNLLKKSAQRKHNKKAALLFQNSINKAIPEAFHSTDSVIFHEMTLSINNNRYRFFYTNQQFSNDLSLKMIVCAMDRERMSRDAYRELSAICKDLPWEWAVASMKQQITSEMNEHIKIIPFNFQLAEKENQIEMGVYRSIKDILKYMIPVWLNKKKLSLDSPIIHIRISGDGQKVGHKASHVMFTFTILNDLENIYKPENHYLLLLYPGKE
ncbi:8118_t:CDS:1, partial [Gigaspora margarita]